MNYYNALMRCGFTFRFILTFFPLAGIVECATSTTGTMVGAMAGTSVTAALTPFLLEEIAISHYEEGCDYY